MLASIFRCIKLIKMAAQSLKNGSEDKEEGSDLTDQDLHLIEVDFVKVDINKMKPRILWAKISSLLTSTNLKS